MATEQQTDAGQGDGALAVTSAPAWTLTDVIEKHRRSQGRALAWIDGERRVSFEEFALRTARLAGSLAAAGVRKGDRVGLLLYNSLEVGEIFFAAARLGAIIVPLNFRHATPEHRRLLADATPVALISEPELLGSVEPLLGDFPELRLRASVGQVAGWQPYEALFEADPVPPTPMGWDDPTVLIYTSGTTGDSKGVTLSQGNLATMCRIVGAARSLGPGIRFLLGMPQCHAGGAMVTLTFPYAGAASVMLRHFSAEAALAAIERERIQHATFAPTMMISVIRSGLVDKYDLSSLDLISYASAPMPLPWLRAALATFRCRFWQGYGLSESCGYITALDPKDHVVEGPPEVLHRLTSAGLPMEGVEVRIVDDEDRDVPVGQVGEVLARSQMVMLGYWNRPDATAATLRGGWLHTGDLARQDADGYVYIVDRKKDLIISGGLNISSVEVERALLSHPDVLEAAVVSVPDDHWGEAVKAYVVPRPGTSPDAEELIAWCRQQIASYKKPRFVEFRTSFPKTAAGKVRKEVLRAEARAAAMRDT